MRKAVSPQRPYFNQPLKQFALSFFVVATFAAYAIREQLTGGSGTTNAATPTLAANLPQVAAQPAPNSASATHYRDGEYTGDMADAYFGYVQIKAVIQGGRVTDVQFLSYPSDRRTSQRINNYAMPYLKNEAIQVQNANVDIVSGATLTSEAFIQSFGAALQQAGGA